MISLHESGGAGRKKPAEHLLQLHLKVVGCRPLIWRRLLVRETMWLSRLHEAIQIVFDWYDYQTHAFSFGDLRFGNPKKGDEILVEDDRDVRLVDLNLEIQGRFAYAYHFDEGWNVEALIEQKPVVKKGVRYPRCLAGSRAGPPEDCGGVDAYHDMLACLQEPNTDLGREWREWLGPGFDPEACDVEALNRALGKLSAR